MKKYIILGLITFFGLNNAVFADGHEQGKLRFLTFKYNFVL